MCVRVCVCVSVCMSCHVLSHSLILQRFLYNNDSLKITLFTVSTKRVNSQICFHSYTVVESSFGSLGFWENSCEGVLEVPRKAVRVPYFRLLFKFYNLVKVCVNSPPPLSPPTPHNHVCNYDCFIAAKKSHIMCIILSYVA